MYQIKPIIKDRQLIKDVGEVCKVLRIEYTALSELIFTGENPHAPNRTFLIASEYSNQKLITVIMKEADKEWLLSIVAGCYDDGEEPHLNKKYLSTRRGKQRLPKKRFRKLFLECFRRWDEVFKPHGEEINNGTGTDNRTFADSGGSASSAPVQE